MPSATIGQTEGAVTWIVMPRAAAGTVLAVALLSLAVSADAQYAEPASRRPAMAVVAPGSPVT
jgi:hypothetical protein